MITVSIEESIKQCCPKAALGLLQCKVQVGEDTKEFLELMNGCIETFSQVELSQANKRDNIQSTRMAYKALGKDPNRYRCSAESMCRRIAKERGLYYINNIVDINNYLSIHSGYSMGTYDLGQIEGSITWRRAPAGTAYQGIGKEVLNLGFLPVLFDDLGPFGNPTSDGTRAMITEKTTEILLVYYMFDGAEGIEELLDQAEALLRAYGKGTAFEQLVLT